MRKYGLVRLAKYGDHAGRCRSECHASDAEIWVMWLTTLVLV